MQININAEVDNEIDCHLHLCVDYIGLGPKLTSLVLAGFSNRFPIFSEYLKLSRYSSVVFIFSSKPSKGFSFN